MSLNVIKCNLENWVDFLEKTTYGNHNLTTEPGELQSRDEERERALRKSMQKNHVGAKLAFVSKYATMILNWKVTSPTAVAFLHLCPDINLQEEEITSGTMDAGVHDYNHPHSGRHPGTAERNNRFRPEEVQFGGDAEDVATSDLTSLLAWDRSMCTIKGLGNTVECYHMTRLINRIEAQLLSGIKVFVLCL